MAGYFSYFPKVYVGEGISDDENFKYRLVKNIFRRVKSREDLAQYSTLFEAYSIRDWGKTNLPWLSYFKIFAWRKWFLKKILFVFDKEESCCSSFCIFFHSVIG